MLKAGYYRNGGLNAIFLEKRYILEKLKAILKDGIMKIFFISIP